MPGLLLYEDLLRICFIFCGSLTAAWSVSDGIAYELTRQGHQVVAVPRGRFGAPAVTLELLNSSDLVIVSGPEHIFGPMVQDNGARAQSEYAFTPEEATLYEWKNEVKVPKVFLYHESNRREDRTFGFEDLLGYADYHFFPAVQDAEQYDQGHFALGRSFWLSFGVDTHVFCPAPCSRCTGMLTGYGPGKISPVTGLSGYAMHELKDGRECPQCLGAGFTKNEKSIQAGFIGLLYPKRIAFLNNLAEHMKRGRDPALQIGRVQIMDIEGTPYEETARRLAANYRRIAVFLNMPHYSELMVTKVTEIMASGTFVMTPILSGPAERNCEPFKHGEHLVYYKPSNYPFLAQTMREFWEREELREKIALSGMMLVRERHSLKARVEDVLSKCKIAKAVTQ